VGRVRDLLQVLEEKQRKSEYVHLIPHVGKVAAGRPKLIATAASTDSVNEVIWAGKTYALLAPWTRDSYSYTFRSDYGYFTTEIQGDSMKGARLEPGDRVLVQHTEDIEEVLGPQDIAVVVIEGQAGPTGLVKRIEKQENAVLLLSENPSYKTRQFAANKVRIQGKVLGILDEKAPQQPSSGPAEEGEE
jgi:SOS-response transcriptional repressor LexA